MIEVTIFSTVIAFRASVLIPIIATVIFYIDHTRENGSRHSWENKRIELQARVMVVWLLYFGLMYCLKTYGVIE